MNFSTSEFESLYTQCFPTAMNMAMALLQDEDEARDVVQEVFLRIWESDSKVENIRAFIIRSVRNASINRLNMLDTRERIKRRLTLETPPENYSPESQNREVAAAVESLLTPREREVVERIYSDGLTYRKTAESLGVSVSAVNKSIVAALKKLRIHFNTGIL